MLQAVLPALTAQACRCCPQPSPLRRKAPPPASPPPTVPPQLAASPGPESPLKALLYDPQTAGGLLAALPREEAVALLAQLAALGYRCAIIGEIVAGAPRITLR